MQHTDSIHITKMTVSNTLNRNTREHDQWIIFGQEWEEKESYKERKDALHCGGNNFMPDVHDVKIAEAADYNLSFTQEKIEDHMNCLPFLKEKIERKKKSIIANVQKADQFVSDSIKTALEILYTQEKIDHLKEEIERYKKSFIANWQRVAQVVSDSIKTALGIFFTQEKTGDHINWNAFLEEEIERYKKSFVANWQRVAQVVSGSIKTALGIFFTQEKTGYHINWIAFLEEEIERYKKSFIANWQRVDQVVSDSIETALGIFYTKEEATDFKYSSHSKDKTSVTIIRRAKELNSFDVIKNKWTQCLLCLPENVIVPLWAESLAKCFIAVNEQNLNNDKETNERLFYALFATTIQYCHLDLHRIIEQIKKALNAGHRKFVIELSKKADELQQSYQINNGQTTTSLGAKQHNKIQNIVDAKIQECISKMGKAAVMEKLDEDMYELEIDLTNSSSHLKRYVGDYKILLHQKDRLDYKMKKKYMLDIHAFQNFLLSSGYFVDKTVTNMREIGPLAQLHEKFANSIATILCRCPVKILKNLELEHCTVILVGGSKYPFITTELPNINKITKKQSQNLNSDMFEHIPGTIVWMNEASMIVQLSTLPKTNIEEMPKENRSDFWRLSQNFRSIYNEFEECSMILTSLNSYLAEKNKFGTHVEDYDEKNNNNDNTEFLFHERIKQNKSKPWYSSYYCWAVTLSIKARLSLEDLQAALNELHKLPTVTLVPNFDMLLPEQRILRQKRPSLSEYFERLHSFLFGHNNRNKIWNNDRFVWPGPLVAAGFSYEGEDDIVVCKYCKCRSDTTRWTDNNESYALRMHKEGKQGRCRFLEVFGGD